MIENGLKLIRYDVENIDGYKDFATFESYLNFRSRKSANALEKINKETRITLKWANQIDIEVLPIPNNVLLLATEYYGSIPDDIGLVAFIRHNFTNYEHLLDVCHNCIGHREAYEVIKTRITKKVCKVLGIKFSIEYTWNTRLNWLTDKEKYEAISMYR